MTARIAPYRPPARPDGALASARRGLAAARRALANGWSHDLATLEDYATRRAALARATQRGATRLGLQVGFIVAMSATACALAGAWWALAAITVLAGFTTWACRGLTAHHHDTAAQVLAKDTPR